MLLAVTNDRLILLRTARDCMLLGVANALCALIVVVESPVNEYN